MKTPTTNNQLTTNNGPTTNKKPKKLRCAIYTRKSTSEGLEAEVTSLDVQRQAGEAYIQSQAQEGWVCLPERYDDGGYSGADLKRPGIERLIQDIEAGRVDVVVVYKVDRLSRSLVDFARLVSVFDERGVSFVAVTQQFNTSTSLGRLTLNILLSFAQFERELISERTRDKIALARRQGRWAGGTPLLGYDLNNSRLVVNRREAKRVRGLFELYLQTGSLTRTVCELNRKGWRTKSWITRKGRPRGGRPFRKSTLYCLLKNVTYLGQVRYKQEIHDGQHEAIVDEELFGQVQQRLAQRRPRRRTAAANRQNAALLAGMFECGRCGGPISLTYTSQGSRRYRYYVCRGAQETGGDRCAGVALPAAGIERFVTAAASEVASSSAPRNTGEPRAQLDGLVKRIAYRADSGQLTIEWKPSVGRPALVRTLDVPTRGQRPEQQTPAVESIPRVARLMALARRLEGLVRDGRVNDYAELARLGHVSRARLSQILSLTLLAPDIQEAVLFLPRVDSGRDPITERDLRPIVAVLDWTKQRRMWTDLGAK